MANAREEHREAIELFVAEQYLFDKQWTAVKASIVAHRCRGSSSCQPAWQQCWTDEVHQAVMLMVPSLACRHTPTRMASALWATSPSTWARSLPTCGPASTSSISQVRKLTPEGYRLQEFAVLVCY